MRLLGFGIRLEEHDIVLFPQTLKSRRRQRPVRVAYGEIVEIAIVDPIEAGRRELTLRLVDGSTISLPFKKRSTLKILSIQNQAAKRVRAARTRPTD